MHCLLQMYDAVFKGYAGAANTHCGGGGLLRPADFEGLAALLVKKNAQGDDLALQIALQRLTHPEKGNKLVRDALAAYEMKLDACQPTIPPQQLAPDDEDEHMEGEASRRLKRPEIQGAMVSMLAPSEGCEAVMDENPTIGHLTSRATGTHTSIRAETHDWETPTAEAAAHTTRVSSSGGYRHVRNACTYSHYVRKTLGSVAYPAGRDHAVTPALFEPLGMRFSESGASRLMINR